MSSASTSSAAIAPVVSRQGLPFELRAVQLDLARQMETVPTIEAFTRFAAGCGYNTLVLYLEGRVQTPSFPGRPAAASYTLADMAQVVATAAEVGVTVVPAVNIFGHSELFFESAAISGLAEERGGGSRFGAPGAAVGRSTFDWTLPATVAFWRTYLGELATVFTGPHMHLGTDECWNLGFGPTSAPLRLREGIARLFMRGLESACGMLRELGKRPWIWDDMFEYFPGELARLPRDVLLCHWGYDAAIDPEGLRAHFGNLERRDWLATYERLGLDVLIAPWGVPNVESFTRYAAGHRVAGGLLTQWEMSRWFLDQARPMVAYCGALWQEPVMDPARAWDRAAADTWPGLPAAARPAFELVAGALGSWPTPSVGAGLQGPMLATERVQAAAMAMAHTALAATPLPADAAAQATRQDLVDAAAAGSLVWRLRALVPTVYNLRRDPAAVPLLERELAAITAAVAALRTSREPLHALRRPGMQPVNGVLSWFAATEGLLADLSARLAAPVAASERRLVLRLRLIDGHGAPRLRVRLTEADGSERWLLQGGPKGGSAKDDSGAFTVAVPFTSEAAPTALRLEVTGWGEYGVTYAEVQSPAGRYLPGALAGATGAVRDASALLVDDSRTVWLGLADYARAILEPARATAVSSVTVRLAPA